MKKNNSNHLAAALQSAMRENRVSAVHVSRKAKALGRDMPGSFLSRIINGNQGFVMNPDLEVIARAISDNPSVRAEIYKARMLDQAPDEAFTLLEIVRRRKSKTDEKLSPAGRKALNFLLGQRNSAVETTLIELARLVGMKP